MKAQRTITLLAVLAVCAQACSPASAPQAPVPATEAEAQTPSKPPADFQGAGLAPATLLGRWGDNGDCTKDIVFNEDGSFLSYTGGAGRWSLNGDRMTMSGAGGTFEVRVTLANQNTLIITNPDGSIGTSQRC